MSAGPVEFVLVEFPGESVDPGIAAAIDALVRQTTIRIIDLVVVRKDLDGVVTATEIHDLEDEARVLLDAIEGEYGGLVSDDDIGIAAASMRPGTTTALLIWENVWATRLADAVAASGGRVLADERIPRDVVAAAFAALIPDQPG